MIEMLENPAISLMQFLIWDTWINVGKPLDFGPCFYLDGVHSSHWQGHKRPLYREVLSLQGHAVPFCILGLEHGLGVLVEAYFF